MIKYYFHIIDNELNNEYDYEGFFTDHFEADRFITENEAVGNVLTMVAPYYEEVPMEEVPQCYKN